ncbi:MAG: hypothetical protein MI861_12390 [Pirellulales bacterium]|nr:hypothetical protein [Pirellulales bacterium]
MRSFQTLLGAWFVGVLTLSSGCQSLAQGLAPAGSLAGPTAAAESTPPVVQASWTDKAKQSTSRWLGLSAGQSPQTTSRAKDLYRQADQLFRQAKNEPKEQSVKTFRKSANLFRKAGEAAPGTALQQDALFMQGESLFFADRLTDATDVYQTLQKDFPRSRHNDRVAARLFSISRYWIDTVKASQDNWFPLNLTDPKKPRLDVDGHAIRVLDQIRYDDPNGRLADDATMAAAAEYIRQRKFTEADEFLTDLRETFTDSDHLFLAHLLGIRCKLEIYAGPKYSGLILEEAEKLVRQTRQRFPKRLQEAKYQELVARASAEIAFKQAERLAYRAEYREKRKEYGAARYYYRELLKHHGDTPQAETARQRLAEIEDLPAVPRQRLAWLKTIFPDSRQATPLQTTQPTDGDAPSDTPILR